MKFNLWSQILLSPADAPGAGGAVAGGDAKGSAPDASPLGLLYPTSQDGKAQLDAAAKPDPVKEAADKAAKDAADLATKTAADKKIADDKAAADAAALAGKDKPKEQTPEEKKAAEDAAAKAKAEAPQKLTAENKTALEKALADATTDEAKAAAKAALDKAVEDDKKATDAEAAAAKAADLFDDGKITMPDGIEVDSALLKQVAPVFKELGLGQVAGQKVVDEYIKIKQGEAAAHVETVQGWLKASEADKEIGGALWTKTQETAKAGLKKFIETHPGTEEINGLLVASGFGNHPAFIKLFNDYGKMTADDVPVTPQAKAGHQQKSTLAILYPDAPQG